jgi:glycosyltransferase involved in cell wall biosynthesis
VSTVTHRFIQHFRDRGLPEDRVAFLPNGANTEFLRPLPPSQALLHRWQLEGKKVFLYVGTHAYYHGLDTLVEAAALLRDDSNLMFLLVGDGPERARLKKIAEARGLTNVIFGTSPYEEMDQLYSIAYASIATLRDLKVARAMRLSKIFPSLSCSVPVIYSGVGEAAELIQAHQCGLAVEPESPGALARAIRTLADDPGMRARFGRAGRALVEREYSWTAIVERWLSQLGMESADARPLVATTVKDSVQ